jgi:hypothetical protein
MPLPKPKTRTDGLRNFVDMALQEVQAGNLAAAELLLVDLRNDIGGAYICLEDPSSVRSPVPTYDPNTDGDYHRWLVVNNID